MRQKAIEMAIEWEQWSRDSEKELAMEQWKDLDSEESKGRK